MFAREKKIFLLFLPAFSVLFFFNSLFAQDTIRKNFLTPSSEYNRKRWTFLNVSTASIYAGTMYGMYELWYRNYPLGKFHFFNDSREWNQVDKIGHAYSAYTIGKAGIDMARWAGVKNKKAIWLGGSLGFLFLTTIETLDGFSEKWGASGSDLLANTGGALMTIVQEFGWKEQRIMLKLSFHEVDYSGFSDAHRKRAKELYGKSLPELTFKDYNGQTYWLSFNLAAFINEEKPGVPQWLNFALGYGSQQMFCGHEEDCIGTAYEFPKRYRQYYFSLDVDLTKIKTKSPLLKSLFSLFNVIKVPFPALEYNKVEEWKAHWVYF